MMACSACNVDVLYDLRVPKVLAVSLRWAFRRDSRWLPSITPSLCRPLHLSPTHHLVCSSIVCTTFFVESPAKLINQLIEINYYYIINMDRGELSLSPSNTHCGSQKGLSELLFKPHTRIPVVKTDCRSFYNRHAGLDRPF